MADEPVCEVCKESTQPLEERVVWGKTVHLHPWCFQQFQRTFVPPPNKPSRG